MLINHITPMQFLPQDPSKVIVTCADSLVRILSGINVIGKYRGMLPSRVLDDDLFSLLVDIATVYKYGTCSRLNLFYI